MKKLFYLLLALPLAFVACNDPEEPTTTTEAQLTLTSEATMNFSAEGGEGVITFTAELKEVTRYEPVPAPVVEALCEADWVTNLTVAENITFTVLANEADARETKVVVSYGDKSFEVAVKQAAKEQNEEPSGVQFTANSLVGEYYGDEYSPGVGNYFIYLSDLGFNEEGYAYPGGTYYRLDLYGPMWDEQGELRVPNGTYTFDANDTMAEWTIGNYYSAYIAFDEEGYTTTGESGYPFTAATLEVTDNGITLEATINGEKHTVTFSGNHDITDYRSSDAPVEFIADYAYAFYFGDQYSPASADNFYFFLSDAGIDADGYEFAGGTYYRFDIFTEIVDTTNGIAMPDGTYTLDLNSAMAPGSFTYEYSAYYKYNAAGDDYDAVGYFTDGTLTKAGNSITAEVVINGVNHTISFTGDLTIYDGREAEEDPEEPVDPEDPETPENPDAISTLTGDLEINLPNAQYALEYYGDYFSTDTDNWMLYIYEDAVTNNGAFIVLDFLSDPYANDIAGTYTPDNGDSTYEQNTFFPGYVDGEDMYGVWYTEMIEGAEITALAPITDGEIKIECAGDVYTITMECVDDAGHKITGTIVANPIDFSAEALSVSPKAKPAKRVATIEKSRIEVKQHSKSKMLTI